LLRSVKLTVFLLLLFNLTSSRLNTAHPCFYLVLLANWGIFSDDLSHPIALTELNLIRRIFMAQTEQLFDDLHRANRSPATPSSSTLTPTTRNLGTLPLGRSTRASGSVDRGATDTYQFTVTDRGRNTITLENQINGSLESVRIVDEAGNLSAGIIGNTTASDTNGDSISGNGRVFNTFSGIRPGTYFLRLRGGAPDSTYAFRLSYQPSRADSDPATAFSSVLNQPAIDFSNVTLNSGD
jgi:hypothetical protein